MKLVAKAKTGERVMVEDSDGGQEYFCPFYAMIDKPIRMFKVNREGVLFFRYEAGIEHDSDMLEEMQCKTGNIGGEGRLHLRAKTALAKKLEGYGSDVIAIEHIIKTEKVFRIADIYRENQGTTYVYEIQRSAINLATLKARTNDYHAAGIDHVIWVLNNQFQNLPELEKYLLDNHYKFGVMEVTSVKKEILSTQF